jgi:anti-sigma B factor antagonist
MLKVHTKNLGTAAILCLEGQIVHGETEILQNVVDSLPLRSSLVLDLSGVSIVDAHGLGVMLTLREQALQRGMRCELINVSEPLRMVLAITRLDSVFPIDSAFQYFPRIAA